MKARIITLVKNSEKKHSVRYDATAKDSPITAVYIMKSAFEGKDYPDKIKVTIEEA
jgi:hypothetical protein